MKQHSLYDLNTGLLTGRTVSTDAPGEFKIEDHLTLHPGMGAVEGLHDHMTKKVNTATGETEDYQPPQPSPDHVWNDTTKRWQLNPQVQARQDARRAALSQIAVLEASQHRTMREATLSASGALERLQTLDTAISLLRLEL